MINNHIILQFIYKKKTSITLDLLERKTFYIVHN